MSRRLTTTVTIQSPKLRQALTMAYVPDIHNGEYQSVMPLLATADAILIGGDLVDRYHDAYDNALRFLHEAPALAPTFYATGNHERKLASRAAYMEQAARTDVTLLDNRWVRFQGLVLGGLPSAWPNEMDNQVVLEMEQQEGFRLLLCHHPEYYEPWVQGHGIDLTLAGHAHGGQIRVLGQGLYSPGQGLLPRLTSGFYHDGKLFVSRGMYNLTRVPRFGNPTELVLIKLVPADR